MTETLECDRGDGTIDPASDDFIRCEVTYLGFGDPPVSHGGPTLYFHNAECWAQYTPQDWTPPA